VDEARQQTQRAAVQEQQHSSCLIADRSISTNSSGPIFFICAR